MKFEEIGWVSAEGDFNHPWAELLQKMQKQAALQGANALIIKEISKIQFIRISQIPREYRS